MKWLKCTLSILLPIVLCSCAVTPYTLAGNNQRQVTQDTHISIVLHEDDGVFLQTAADEYSKLHPEVKISIDRLNNDSNYDTSLMSEMHGDQLPTAFAINGVYDLQFWQNDARILPFKWLQDAPLSEQVSVGPNCYALVLNLTGYGVIYNVKMLDVLEVDHSAIHTYAGLQAVVQAVNDKIASGEAQQKYPDLKTAICSSADLVDLTIPVDQNDTLSLDSQKNLQGIVDLLPKDDQADSAAQLAEYRTAIYLGGSDIQEKVEQIYKETADNLRIAPLDVSGVQNNVTIGCDYLIVNRFSGAAEQQALLDFLDWLYNSEDGQAVLCEAGVLSPYGVSGESTLGTATTVLQSTLYSLARTEQVQYSQIGCAPSGWESEVFHLNIGNYRKNKSSWEDVIRELEEKWSRKYRP